MMEVGEGGPTAVPRSGLRWTLFGRLSMTAANGVLMLLCALVWMDDATFGSFAAVVGAQMLASRGVLAGLDQGLVRLFTTGSSPDGIARAAIAITGTLGLITLLGAGAAAAAGGIAEIPPILVLAVGLGAAGSAWFDLGCSALLARLRYRAAGSWIAVMPAVRLAATAIACTATPSDHWLPFVVFPAVTLLGGLTLLGRTIAHHGFAPDRATVHRVFRYSWWIGLGDAAAVLALQSGVFLLKGLGMHAQAGRFAFALQLVQGFFAVFVAFYQALLPKAARLPNLDALPVFLHSAWRTAAVLAAAIGGTALVAAAIVPLLIARIRPEFVGFVPEFLALTAFTAVLMFEAPLGIACQYLLRPRLHVLALWLRCVFILAGGLWLVPAFEGIGAASAAAIGAVLAATVLFGVVQGAIGRRRREAEQDEEEAETCAAS